MKQEEYDHQDLEEIFQISTSVEFSTESVPFEGLEPMEINIKKRVEKQTKIENVSLGKTNRNSLF